MDLSAATYIYISKSLTFHLYGFVLTRHKSYIKVKILLTWLLLPHIIYYYVQVQPTKYKNVPNTHIFMRIKA